MLIKEISKVFYNRLHFTELMCKLENGGSVLRKIVCINKYWICGINLVFFHRNINSS